MLTNKDLINLTAVKALTYCAWGVLATSSSAIVNLEQCWVNDVWLILHGKFKGYK
jgi:hypothetical protein